MNTFSDKPKRKAKPKRSRRSRIIILLLLILLVALVGAYLITLPQPKRLDSLDMDTILNPPDGDPFTPLCSFENDIQFHVSGNNFQYIIRPSDKRIITHPDLFSLSQHVAGSPYAWATGIETQLMLDLETGSITIIEESIDYSYIYSSRTNRYVLKLKQHDNNIQDMVIYDGKTQTRLIETQTTNKSVHWSVSDKYLILFNSTARSHAQLIDMETFTFSDANLPSNTDYIRGWIDDETILYETPAGRLYTWSVLSGDTKEFTDIRFNGFYNAGGVQYSPNLESRLRQHNWVGGMDDKNTFHLFDVSNPDFHERISMSVAKGFHFNIGEEAIRFEYDTKPVTMTLYYPNESMRSVDVTLINENSYVQFSSDGKYGLYFPNETQSDHIVQNFATNETMIIDADSVEDFMNWKEIEGISYLQYASLTPDGAYVHYLLQPDTKDRCKLGTFYTPYIVTLA